MLQVLPTLAGTGITTNLNDTGTEACALAHRLLRQQPPVDDRFHSRYVDVAQRICETWLAEERDCMAGMTPEAFDALLASWVKRYPQNTQSQMLQAHAAMASQMRRGAKYASYCVKVEKGSTTLPHVVDAETKPPRIIAAFSPEWNVILGPVQTIIKRALKRLDGMNGLLYAPGNTSTRIGRLYDRQVTRSGVGRVAIFAGDVSKMDAHVGYVHGEAYRTLLAHLGNDRCSVYGRPHTYWMEQMRCVTGFGRKGNSATFRERTPSGIPYTTDKNTWCMLVAYVEAICEIYSTQICSLFSRRVEAEYTPTFHFQPLASGKSYMVARLKGAIDGDEVVPYKPHDFDYRNPAKLAAQTRRFIRDLVHFARTTTRVIVVGVHHHYWDELFTATKEYACTYSMPSCGDHADMVDKRALAKQGWYVGTDERDRAPRLYDTTRNPTPLQAARQAMAVAAARHPHVRYVEGARDQALDATIMVGGDDAQVLITDAAHPTDAASRIMARITHGGLPTKLDISPHPVFLSARFVQFRAPTGNVVTRAVAKPGRLLARLPFLVQPPSTKPRDIAALMRGVSAGLTPDNHCMPFSRAIIAHIDRVTGEGEIKLDPKLQRLTKLDGHMFRIGHHTKFVPCDETWAYIAEVYGLSEADERDFAVALEHSITLGYIPNGPWDRLLEVDCVGTDGEPFVVPQVDAPGDHQKTYVGDWFTHITGLTTPGRGESATSIQNRSGSDRDTKINTQPTNRLAAEQPSMPPRRHGSMKVKLQAGNMVSQRLGAPGRRMPAKGTRARDAVDEKTTARLAEGGAASLRNARGAASVRFAKVNPEAYTKLSQAARDVIATRPTEAKTAGAQGMASLFRAFQTQLDKRAQPAVLKRSLKRAIDQHTAAQDLLPKPGPLHLESKAALGATSAAGGSGAGLSYSRNTGTDGPLWKTASVRHRIVGGQSTVEITNREPWGPITASSLLKGRTVPINPSSDMFTWLSSIARVFDQYIFTKFSVDFITESATNVPGRVMMNFDTDPGDAIPNNRTGFETQQGTRSIADWKNGKCVLPIAQTLRQNMFLMGGPTDNNMAPDVHETTQARFQVATADFPPAMENQPVGELWSNYTVALGRMTSGSGGTGALTPPSIAVSQGTYGLSSCVSGITGILPQFQVNASPMISAAISAQAETSSQTVTPTITIFVGSPFTQVAPNSYLCSGGMFDISLTAIGLADTVAPRMWTTTGADYSVVATPSAGVLAPNWRMSDGSSRPQITGPRAVMATGGPSNQRGMTVTQRVVYPAGRAYAATPPIGVSSLTQSALQAAWDATGMPYVAISIASSSGGSATWVETSTAILKSVMLAPPTSSLGTPACARYLVCEHDDGTTSTSRATDYNGVLSWQEVGRVRTQVRCGVDGPTGVAMGIAKGAIDTDTSVAEDAGKAPARQPAQDKRAKSDPDEKDFEYVKVRRP